MAVCTYSETLSCRRVLLLQILSVLLVPLSSAPLATFSSELYAFGVKAPIVDAMNLFYGIA